jgi:hypothetical protein
MVYSDTKKCTEWTTLKQNVWCEMGQLLQIVRAFHGYLMHVEGTVTRDSYTLYLEVRILAWRALITLALFSSKG